MHSIDERNRENDKRQRALSANSPLSVSLGAGTRFSAS